MKENLKWLLEEGDCKFSKKLLEGIARGEQVKLRWSDVYAEHLINNGVIVLPCKVGDTVYEVRKVRCSIMDGYREFDWDIRTLSFSVDMFNAIGKSIFLTREEAKKVLEEKVREMLIAEHKG